MMLYIKWPIVCRVCCDYKKVDIKEENDFIRIRRKLTSLKLSIDVPEMVQTVPQSPQITLMAQSLHLHGPSPHPRCQPTTTTSPSLTNSRTSTTATQFTPSHVQTYTYLRVETPSSEPIEYLPTDLIILVQGIVTTGHKENSIEAPKTLVNLPQNKN